MSLSEFVSLLETTGYRVAFEAFPEENAPEMPFITYYTPNTENSFADNKVLLEVMEIEVSLWTNKKDETAETLVKQVLNNNEIPWDYTCESHEDEHCIEVIFNVQI